MLNGLRWLCLCLLLIPLVGCRGCTPQAKPQETPEEAAARRKKVRLASENGLRALPYATDVPGNFLKGGHWYQANSKLKANFGDESLAASVSVINKEKNKVPFVAGQTPINFNRNLSLSVGQEKNIQFQFFQPEIASTAIEEDGKTMPTAMRVLYTQRGIGVPILEEDFPGKLLPGYQYNLVTLSRDPSRYTFWRGLDCIVWPSRQRMSEERIAPHRIIDMNENEVASQFPTRLYAMTTISHVVLNDSSVSILSTDQQDALLDWLHFGGTIVLNGPEAIGGIESSWMKNLAPIIQTTNALVSPEEISMLNETWSIAQIKGGRELLAPEKPIPKLAGKLSEGATWVGYLNGQGEAESLEGLIAERQLGQGRIVMTAFPMTDAAFLRWPSYSSLIHNTILRKPNRQPTAGEEADTRYANEWDGNEQNPMHSTRLRLWARDLDESTVRNPKLQLNPNPQMASGARRDPTRIPDISADTSKVKRSSLGAWNPQSRVLANARQSLQESSGISVPKINTIIKLLIGYLVVLVPVNWLVFRLLGRVELAWAAAPLIALIGAFVVASSVQLDVGFSRSETSYGFLEVHSGYPRGLHSSYTALYTSLTTNYRAVFEKETGVVLPFASTVNSRKPRGNQSKIDYSYAGESGAGLQSIPVLSNTTGLFQAEEMIDLGGKFTTKFDDEFAGVTVASDASFPIYDVGVIGVNDAGELVSGWLGKLEAASESRCTLETRGKDARWREEWDGKATLSKPSILRAEDGSQWTDQDLGGDLYLGAMLNDLVNNFPLAKGQFLAIGWTDIPLGSLNISPIATQRRHRSVVMMHLRADSIPLAKPDVRIFEKQQMDGE